jgi:hypothetical protein
MMPNTGRGSLFTPGTRLWYYASLIEMICFIGIASSAGGGEVWSCVFWDSSILASSGWKSDFYLVKIYLLEGLSIYLKS